MKKWYLILGALFFVTLLIFGLYKLFLRPKMENNKVVKISQIQGFGRPFSVVKDQSGNLYVCDFGTNTVKVYDQNNIFIREIGSSGTGPGQFKMPHAVDFDRQGNLIITDYGNKRVQKFTSAGEYISTLETPKKLSGPATSYFDKNFNLYVSDFDSASVLKFSSDLKFIGFIGMKTDNNLTSGWEMKGDSQKTTLPGGFDRVHSARVDEDGNIYIVDTWNHRIERFSSNGDFTGWIGARPDGTLTNGWQTAGEARSTNQPGGFNAPIALDFAGKNELMILEYQNPRIQRFSKKSGKFISWFGADSSGTVGESWKTSGTAKEGSAPGAVELSYDLKVYGKKVYIADTGNHRVQIIEFEKDF